MNDIILKWGNFEMSLFNSDEIKVENIENLTWGNTELATTNNPYLPGDSLQNSRPLPRDITITIHPLKKRGDYSDLIHKLSRLYNHEIWLIWKNRTIPPCEASGGRTYPALITDLRIKGIVNEFETPRFGENNVKIILNVHCSNPFWTAATASTVTDFLDAYTTFFCNYSEIATGFKLELTNVLLSAENSYIDIEMWANPAPYILHIRPVWKGSSISKNYVCFVFEKGSLSVKAGADAASAVDASELFKWSMSKGRQTSPFAYVMERYNGFPELPVSTKEMSLTVTGSGDTNSAKLTWNAKFI